MSLHSYIAKSVIWLTIIAASIAAFHGLSLLNKTIYLEIPIAVYISLVAVTGSMLAVRFYKKREQMTASRYASESLAAVGFLILACFLVIPEGIAALNYYLPYGSEPYQWDCTVTDKQTNYTRGTPYYYVTFTPDDGAGTFRLKVSSHNYKQMRTGHCYHLTLRNGALSYPIIESIAR